MGGRSGGLLGLGCALPRKRLEKEVVVSLRPWEGGRVTTRAEGILGERFTLPLQQVVSCLGALELGFHYAQGLPCREDGFPVLTSGQPLPLTSRMVGDEGASNVLLRRTLLRIAEGRQRGKA